jgi:hypothetical protein
MVIQPYSVKPGQHLSMEEQPLRSGAASAESVES